MTLFEFIIIIILIIILIFMLPFIMDQFLKYFTRDARFKKILQIAKHESKILDKPLIIIESANRIKIFNRKTNSYDETNNDIFVLLDRLEDNSVVIVILNTFEYLDASRVYKLFKKISRVSNGDIYMINIENNSPITYLDSNIKNLFDKQFYFRPTDIVFYGKNNIQKTIGYIYRPGFMLIKNIDFFSPYKHKY
jgi:hypothetical protein